MIWASADKHAERLKNFTAGSWEVLAFATRSDGYMFYAVRHRDVDTHLLRVFAGCRKNYSFGAFRTHTSRYARFEGARCGTAKRKETLAILAALEATAKAKWSKT